MPSNATRQRIDWCPGDAALQALAAGEELFPTLKRQDVIDRLLITGLCAYLGTHWQPPPFVGTQRDRWRLPAYVPERKRAPGNRPQGATQASHFPGVGNDWPAVELNWRRKEPGND